MQSPFQHRNSCVAVQLVENTDPNGKHLEYRDTQGALFACMVKVYRNKILFGLVSLSSNVDAEFRDAAGNLLLTSTSYRGDTKRECKVELHDANGTLIGILYDAHWGADFETPDGTLVGKARRPERPPNEPQSEPKEVMYTFLDAVDQVVGTCDRRSPVERHDLLELIDGRILTGPPAQTVKLEAPVTPLLHTFVFLFPALQLLRYARSG